MELLKPEIRKFIKLTFTPHWSQFIVNEKVSIIIFASCFVYGGIVWLPYRSFVAILAGIIFIRMLYKYMYMISQKYHVSGEQLVYEHGVLQRKVDYIELYRVIDFTEIQSLTQRIVQTKTVIIHSGDRTKPTLRMVGMKETSDIVGIIRERVEYNKKRKGVYEITNR